MNGKSKPEQPSKDPLAGLAERMEQRPSDPLSVEALRYIATHDDADAEAMIRKAAAEMKRLREAQPPSNDLCSRLRDMDTGDDHTTQTLLMEAVDEIERLRDALKQVGDDYPGSSCQKWCYQQAGIAEPDLADEVLRRFAAAATAQAERCAADETAAPRGDAYPPMARSREYWDAKRKSEIDRLRAADKS